MAEIKKRHRLLYAQGSMGMNILNLTIVTWVMYFYAPPEGIGRPILVPVALAGLLLTLGRFVDAITDPLIGYWSDNTKSKRGRRIPFILYGTPLLIASFILIWFPPHQHLCTFNAIYLLLLVNIYFTLFTVVCVPMDAALPEIADTSEERIGTSLWKVVFGVIGTALAATGAGALIARFGFQKTSGLLALPALVSLYLVTLGIKEKPRKPADLQSRLNIFGALKATFSNKYFLFFGVSMIAFNLGLQLMMIVLPYFVIIIIKKTEAGVSLFQGIFMGVMMLSLPLWARLGDKVGKRKANLLALLGLAVWYPFFFFTGFLTQISKITQGILFLTVAALPVAGLYVFYNALLADIVDYDELKTHKRREAMYWGITGFLIKASYGVSALVAGLLFSKFGNTVENPLGIRLTGPVVGLVGVVGFLVFLKYRLPDSLRGKTLEEL